MDLGKKIAYYRKNKEITQDALAKMLGISNQAVSKWETNQSCPDIELLPMIADVFEITLDELFDRQKGNTVDQASLQTEMLPWEDDETLRAVLFVGRRVVKGETLQDNVDTICKEITFTYDGMVRNVESYFNVCCENVEGSVTAGGYVECGDVGGSVTAGTYVECNNVGGGVTAGSYVECNDVGEGITAGAYVECNDVGEGITAGTYVECGDVGKNVMAGEYVECGDVSGYVLKN